MLTLFLLACPPDNKPPTESTSKESSPKESNPSENHAPEGLGIHIDPASPLDDDALSVVLDNVAADPDGDTVSYQYVWSQNGTVQTSLSTETVSADLTNNGDVWSVTVTPTDGSLEGTAATASVNVGNLPPIAPTIHIDPLSPSSGDILTLVFDTPASDPESQPLTQSIRWQEDQTLRTDLNDETVVPGVEVSAGATWMVTVSVTDGINAPVEASTSVVVNNTPPELLSVTITPTLPGDDYDLTCVIDAQDADDPRGRSLTYDYHWFKDGVEETSYAGQNTVSAASTTVGESWVCEGTVSDGYDSVTDTSAAVEIQGPTIVYYTKNLDARLTPDGAGSWSAAEGDYSVRLQTSGLYGNNDCDIYWTLVGTPKANVCRGCEFDFSVDYTYDANRSTLNTASCTTAAIDAQGSFYYTTRSQSGQLNFDNYSVVFNLYYYSSYYGTVPIPISPYLDLGENSVDTGGYGYNSYRTLTFSRNSDSQGYDHIQAGYAVYFRL